MKANGGPAILLGLTIPAMCLTGFHPWFPWIVGVPALLWSLFLLLGGKRWTALQDQRSTLFGLCYGAFGGVIAAAGLRLAAILGFSTAHMRYPYDSTACAIILSVSGLLLLGVAVLDFWKWELKPFWLRLVTALVAFLPCMVMALCAMGVGEAILRPYVS